MGTNPNQNFTGPLAIIPPTTIVANVTMAMPAVTKMHEVAVTPNGNRPIRLLAATKKNIDKKNGSIEWARCVPSDGTAMSSRTHKTNPERVR